jgi:hypothetical protein
MHAHFSLHHVRLTSLSQLCAFDQPAITALSEGIGVTLSIGPVLLPGGKTCVPCKPIVIHDFVGYLPNRGVRFHI